MIQNPAGIVMTLLLIEGLILYVSEHAAFKKYFKFIPSMFWIYFLPMVASTAGLIPAQSEVYQTIPTFFLPASLLLLLIAADIPAIFKLGRPALLMMLTGSLGIMIGAPLTLLIFKKWLSPDAWAGFGALSGSWIGGSANMIAVKEAIHAPDSVFLPMIVVDTIVSYSWMGLLIALAVFQTAYDHWNRSDTGVMKELNRKVQSESKTQARELQFGGAALIFLFAIAGTLFSLKLAHQLPEIKNIISTYTWTIVLASTFGILLSFTGIKKLESLGASRIGYVLLYFVLTSIGARANLSTLTSAPLLIVAGFVWVLIHALFLFIVSRWIKAPMFLIATASQANIGGPASAPIVAAIYQPNLAAVGLLLAILGNILGTYLGILTAQLCRLTSQI
jgi:uncharacterized membrane protein